MLFFYVRHGDPIYDPDSLTPLGHRQAEAISKRFAVYGLDEIYSSPSVRARQTAEPTCEVLKKEPVILDWCCESRAWAQMTVEYEPGKLTWGYQHQPTKELFVSPEVRALRDKWYTHPAFEGTKFAEGVARVEGEVDKLMLSLGYRHEGNGYIAERPNDDRVALFAHQGFGSLFLSCLLDIPYPEFSTHYDLQHTGLTVIEFRDEDGYVIPRILTMGNDAHLYREGLPLKYNSRHVF
jgi:probable phosphoglycerate mutase